MAHWPRSNGIEFRLPYNSDPIAREKINRGEMEYFDMHLSQVAPMAWQGFLGPLDAALIEVTGIRADGSLIPSSSVGNNKTWLDRASRLILEVNRWQNPALEGMHDIYYGTALPPHRVPIPLVRPDDRIGEPHFRCDPDKIVAIVETDAPDRNLPFARPDSTAAVHRRTSSRVLPARSRERQAARFAAAAAIGSWQCRERGAERARRWSVREHDVLYGGDPGRHDRTDEVRQTARGVGHGLLTQPGSGEGLNANMDQFRDRMILRPQEISNHPELIRRLGCLAMNGLIEADIYGAVNSTHVMGSRIQNGIGGSGDFARNAYVSIFMTPSTAKGGKISAIVPQGQSCRSHQPGRASACDGARARRSTRPVAETARRTHHRQMRAPRLSASPRRLLQACAAGVLRSAVAHIARRGTFLASALPGNGHDAELMARRLR